MFVIIYYYGFSNHNGGFYIYIQSIYIEFYIDNYLCYLCLFQPNYIIASHYLLLLLLTLLLL
jgi:hypothetical protein